MTEMDPESITEGSTSTTPIPSAGRARRPRALRRRARAGPGYRAGALGLPRGREPALPGGDTRRRRRRRGDVQVVARQRQRRVRARVLTEPDARAAHGHLERGMERHPAGAPARRLGRTGRRPLGAAGSAAAAAAGQPDHAGHAPGDPAGHRQPPRVRPALHPFLRRWDQQPDTGARPRDPGRAADGSGSISRTACRSCSRRPGAVPARRLLADPGPDRDDGVLWPQSRDEHPAPLAVYTRTGPRATGPRWPWYRRIPGDPVGPPGPVRLPARARHRDRYTAAPAPASETGTPPPSVTDRTPSTPTAPPTNPATAPAPAHPVTPPPAPITETLTPQPAPVARDRYTAARAFQRDRDAATIGNRANTIHADGAPHQTPPQRRPRPRPEDARAGHRTRHAAARRSPARHAFRAGQ